MAYNSTTQSYDEYPESPFPGSILDFPDMVDVSATLQPIIDQYKAAMKINDTATMATLKSQYPDIEKCNWNAKKNNVLLQNIKAMQTWIKEKLTESVANAVGINDMATGADRLINTYSINKIDSLLSVKTDDYETKIENATGIFIANNVAIKISDWVSDTSVVGYNYSYTYNNTNILATDEMIVSFSNSSMLNASKAFIVVKEDNVAGSFTLMSRKLPKSDLTIREIKVVR